MRGHLGSPANVGLLLLAWSCTEPSDDEAALDLTPSATTPAVLPTGISPGANTSVNPLPVAGSSGCPDSTQVTPMGSQVTPPSLPSTGPSMLLPGATPSTEPTESGPSPGAGGTPGAIAEPGEADASSGGSTALDAGSGPEPALNLPEGVLAMFPPPDAAGLCIDPNLTLRFDQPVQLNNSGAFVVREVSSGDVVVQVDLGQSSVRVNVAGSELSVPPPAFVVDDPTSGAESDLVVVSLAAGKLEYGRAYEVVLEGDPIVDLRGQALAVFTDLEWTFATRSSAPSGGELSVGASSAADYCSVQGALDAASDGTTIDVAAGVYPGLLRLQGKDDITLRGEARDKTVLLGVNNENLNGGTRFRPLFLAQSLRGLHLESLTLKNLTPQGGSQAEALALLDCDECIVRDATVESLQDTLLWSGRIYAEQCLIIGNVDYIWGTGTAFFEECEIRTVGRKGYNLQARNPAGSYGYVFVDSKLTADPGITGDILARIDVGAYPASQVAYIDCEMGNHIAPEGWIVTGSGSTDQLRFWEYNSRSPSGDAIDTSRRAAGSRQLSAAEANGLRDPAVVLGGWSP